MDVRRARHLPPRYLSPSYCTPDYYSGITSCTYGSYTPGIFLPGSGGAPGYATAARVFVAAAMGLLWLAGRATSTSVRRHRLLAAAVVAAAGAAVAGSAARSGAVVMLLSVGCLAVALRRDASASDPVTGAAGQAGQRGDDQAGRSRLLSA